MKVIDYGVCQPWKKLGDSIVYHSAFIHYGKCQWLNVQDSKKIPPNWKWVANAYAKEYTWEVEIVRNIPKVQKNFMRQCLLDNVKIARLPSVQPLDLKKPYVTVQTQGLALSQGRPAPHYKTISKRMVETDLHIVDISIFKTLDKLQAAIEGAEEHIGVDSGGAWMALACGKPCTVISTADKMDEHYRAMHMNALRLLEDNGAKIKHIGTR